MLRQNKLGCFSVTNISRLNMRLQGKALGVTTDTQHNNKKIGTQNNITPSVVSAECRN